MGAALIGLGIVAPWLVWLPVSPVATILFGVLALLGAFHGLGRLLGRVTKSKTDVALAMAHGAAVAIAIAGLMIALHVYDARLIVITGAAAHSADLAIRFGAARDSLEPLLAWSRARYWLVPVAIATTLAGVHALAAAGQVAARSFDDDGDVIAQVERVSQTGALADPIGYPRVSQLGGEVAAAALVTVFAEPRNARLVDSGLGFALLLVLALSRIRPRDAGSAVWASLIVLAAAAVVVAGRDLMPVYLPAALILALYLQLDGPASGAALVGGALCVLRGELAPVAVVLLVGVWWRARRPWREDLPRVAVLAGVSAAVAVPYAIARAMAWHGIDRSAMSVLEAPHGSAILRLALAVAIALASAPLLVFALRELADARLSWFAAAAALAVGAMVSRLSGEWPVALHALWSIAFAGGAVIAILLVERSPPSRTGFVLVFLVCLLLRDAQDTSVLARWSWHTFARLTDVEYVRHAGPEGAGYDDLLAAIPPGDTVAVWVARPELLDYSDHRILDLRTPRVAKLRDSDRLAPFLAATHAKWLLFEQDDAALSRARGSFVYRWTCARHTPACADALERIALEQPIVARGAVRLLSLR